VYKESELIYAYLQAHGNIPRGIRAAWMTRFERKTLLEKHVF
jgi:hypothetical protein